MEQTEKEKLEESIRKIELDMSSNTFWDDKEHAKQIINELNDLRESLKEFSKYDSGDAVITIYAGAGGDDSEDFVSMLFHMYSKYIENRNWNYSLIHENKTDHGGYRNITFEINGTNVFGDLKGEGGVHRLVRISPFNAKKRRHTSFALVEVVPKFKRGIYEPVSETELEIEFSKSAGPGGQNVNKRETAVRVVHKKTKISATSQSERSQELNKEKAIDLVNAKLYAKRREVQEKEERSMKQSVDTQNEWGSQIRSYVLHPYKLVKDHRTGVEETDTDKILLDGKLEEFISAEKEK